MQRELLRNNQYVFRENGSYTDQLFTIIKMIENCIENNLPMKINLIDFHAAFDSVHREYIWQALEHYDLPAKYTDNFWLFCSNTLRVVGVVETLTGWFEVASGTGQVVIQAQPLLNIILNSIKKLCITALIKFTLSCKTCYWY